MIFSLFHRVSPLAANIADTAENITVAIGAANDRALFTNDDQWEQITPWGNFPNSKGLQRITPKQGADMVEAFNSIASKLKNGFRGVPVYVGHPDIDPVVYKDHHRIGKIMKLEARDDGLYCQVAWNDLGEKNKEQGYFVYPSGVWRFKKCLGGVIEPFELRSVGLTNLPNIASVKPWARNDSQGESGRGTGSKNAMAVRVRANMAAKKMGRKPMSRDYDAAADALNRAAAKRSRAPMPNRSSSSGPGNHVHIHSAANDGRTVEQLMKMQKDVELGHSAGLALLQKAAEFRSAGDTEATALLKAKAALPESAAVHARHVVNLEQLRAEEEQRKTREEFLAKVKARMASDNLSYHDAWMKEKAAAKANKL